MIHDANGFLSGGARRVHHSCTMRADIIGHFEACMTEIYLHIVARMADYMATHPTARLCRAELAAAASACTMRVELIGHLKPCTTDIYIHI